MQTLTELTLNDCRKDELIKIISRLTELFGDAAKEIVDLELSRIDYLRLKEELRSLSP